MKNSISDRINSMVRQEVIDIPAYAAGMTIERARNKLSSKSVINLSLNENPLGISSIALQAMTDAAQSAARYPDSGCFSLREKIAAKLALPVEQVIIGNGSEDILSMICKTFITPGAKVLLAKPTFSLYSIYTQMMGGKIVDVPMSQLMNYHINDWLEAIATHPTLRVLMLANPSNPVGCTFDQADFIKLIEACPPNTLLVIDEAYHEFAVDRGAFPDSIKILEAQNRPWIVLRTFSKAYGLAGLRVGYGLVSEPSIVRLFDRVRTPYNVNRFAQVAAMAAMDDAGYLTTTKTLIRTQRKMVKHQLNEMGLFVATSNANFLFVNVQQKSAAVAQALMKQGILVKPWTEPGYDNCIRVTIGTHEQNTRFLNELERVLSR